MNLSQFESLVSELKNAYHKAKGKRPNTLIIPLAKRGEVRDAVRDLIKFTDARLLVRGELPPTIFGLKPVFSEYSGFYAVENLDSPVDESEPLALPAHRAEEVVKMALAVKEFQASRHALNALTDGQTDGPYTGQVQAARTRHELACRDLLSFDAFGLLLFFPNGSQVKPARMGNKEMAGLLRAMASLNDGVSRVKGAHDLVLDAAARLEEHEDTLASVAPLERQHADDLQQRSAGVVNAVWEELRSRKLDIQELVDNSDRELLGDIYEGLRRAVVAGFSNPPAHPFEEG